MKKEEKKVSIETMTGVGKKKKIAGREYLILPVNIRDMHLVIGKEGHLFIIGKSELEDENNPKWQLFGLNYTDEELRPKFLYVINKYVYYIVGDEKIPMTEELLIEHNWSFKEIGEFLFTWCEISD